MPAKIKLSRRVALAAGATATVSMMFPGWAQPQSDKALRIVGQVEISSLEPATGSGFIMLRMGIGETLVALNEEGQIAPGLAISWANEGNGRSWRLALRSGVIFHDGTPFTAESAVASLSRAASSAQGLKVAGIAAIRVAGPLSLEIETTEPNAILPRLLTEAGTIVLAPSSYGTDGKVQRPVGTGPYRFESLAGRTELHAAAFPGYWGPKPAINRAVYIGTVNPETRTNIALADDAEVIFNVPAPSLARVEAAGLKIENVQLPRTLYVILNIDLPAFRDVNVRRALSLAVDRSAMASAVMRDPSAAAAQIFAPTMPEWQAVAHYGRYDPAAAAALLDAAGWRLGSDGIRARDGERLAFELFSYATRAEIPLGATILQSMWKRIGVDVQILSGEWTVVPERQRTGTLQASMMSRGYTVVADPIPLVQADFARERSEWGSMNWRNDRVRAIAAQYSSTFQAEARARISGELAQIIADEMPVIPLLWTPLAVALSKRITGVTVDPYEMRFFIERIRWV